MEKIISKIPEQIHPFFGNEIAIFGYMQTDALSKIQKPQVSARRNPRCFNLEVGDVVRATKMKKTRD